MRVLVVFISVMFLASCSSKLAYNNLDWWVYWYMDDYIELKDEQEEKFDEAVKLYNQIIDNGYEGAELYYNLGNAYFRLGKLGYAILYYEN